MNIILFGYRGSGKTSIGRKLADQLWKDFVDTDALVRGRFDDKTIAEIWQASGEAAFRAAEVEVTKDVVGRGEVVIALGGGTLLQAEARAAVAAADGSKRIYLYCEPDELLRRIDADQATADERPNLTDQGGGIDEIKSVLAQRDPVYRAVADEVFDVTHLNIEDATRYLIKNCL